jgi:glycosyltransferase involved in cell wall biosynthesis
LASRLASSEAPPASLTTAATPLAPAPARVSDPGWERDLDNAPGRAPDRTPDLVCLSHLRWDFVTQRPQHLMTRFARDRRVFFVEEPVLLPDGEREPRLALHRRPEGVQVVLPHLPPGLSAEQTEVALAGLLRGLLAEHGIDHYVLWYYTPMALAWTADLAPSAVVYDCMDELSLFKGAPPELLPREQRLLEAADLVFTGGASLFEAKRDRHPEVHLFPSSIDAAHFGRARDLEASGLATSGMETSGLAADQTALPRPRLGFFGVLDERLDIELLAELADLRPDWQIVLVGPVVKIDPADLPRRPNLHYLGKKEYAELPAYLAGWDVALLPFAQNDSTRFISPTKTPEYLAGGRPVVSTPIRDVVRPYGELGLVEIAGGAPGFAAAVERCLAQARDRPVHERWLGRVDELLAGGSWDETQRRMAELISAVVAARRADR